MLPEKIKTHDTKTRKGNIESAIILCMCYIIIKPLSLSRLTLTHYKNFFKIFADSEKHFIF